MALSLAAIRYRSVLSARGGPIESIEEGELEVSGERYFQANARLKRNLVPKRDLQLYSDADGTGIHSSPMVARHIAVSEALERWAYHAIVGSSAEERYGFDVDPSSNGMAAFPGFGIGTARRAARFEAIERFCLLNWWEWRLDGCLKKTQWPGISAVSFEPAVGGAATILFMRSPSGFYAYGHAAGESFDDACVRARLELVRHEWAIRSRIELGDSKPLSHPFENRSWFFSTREGHQIFIERTERRSKDPCPHWEVACNSEIPGPWSEYATVWRYLFRPPSTRFISDERDYFFW